MDNLTDEKINLHDLDPSFNIFYQIFAPSHRLPFFED